MKLREERYFIELRARDEVLDLGFSRLKRMKISVKA